MKKINMLITVLILVCSSLSAQNQPADKMPEPQIRQYWFVLLTSGPNRSQDSVTAAKLQIGHLNNIRRLYSEGKVKVAGPFGEEGDTMASDWQGYFVFDCAGRQEVEELLKTDPAIAAGRMIYHIKAWYTVPTGSFVPGKPQKPLF